VPRIFDNIDNALLPALRHTLAEARRADFCVGYFNLRGWKLIDAAIEGWAGGEGACCRVLVGMQSLPQDEMRAGLSLTPDQGIDQAAVHRLKKAAAEEFREQLTVGAPTNADEAGLRRLSAQLRAGKVVVGLYLRHHLHAKLYLLHRADYTTPIVGYLGSSNLTQSGLRGQGELNLDVVEHDACLKLQKWFDERWADRWRLDISGELADLIDASWARETALPPYYVYLKMAYHLSREARAGLAEFRIPRDFRDVLFPFQAAAVQIAAHHLNKRGGVLIGDVVGLGKTLMASALVRIFQDDQGVSTLILCPRNLTAMWQSYVDRYGLSARVMALSVAIRDLPTVPARFRLVLIDESHNLRNREGRRYRAISDYIESSGAKCILLSATPYNKTYLDLSAQLRLFVPADLDLGIRPEAALRQIGETEFIRRHQCSVRSIAAFEYSDHADDWRELMRLYMVRRTRGFVRDTYALRDEATGRPYLRFADGSPSYFPVRRPRTLTFMAPGGPGDAGPDPYALLYAEPVVNAINTLTLPRYGLGNYIAPRPHTPPKPAEAATLAGLGRAGKRLMGFCRTNLFKRLESGGPAFLQSVQRHLLRNFVYLHALESGLPLPLGTQDADLLDPGAADEDAEATLPLPLDDGEAAPDEAITPAATPTEAAYRARAAAVYAAYGTTHRKRFTWLNSGLFVAALRHDLLADAHALLGVLEGCGAWEARRDSKLAALERLLTTAHPQDKVLVFTQFADTARYLTAELKARGVAALEGVTGDAENPTALAWRFSPHSNDRRQGVSQAAELRVLIATDVLSEGQNLQDCAIIVNYDLPWAIIRLIQRAGRVDRIGQRAAEILCYSFLPADGVERIIRLRSRVRQRLLENDEVVGADEAFFEDDLAGPALRDLYNEKAGVMDGDGGDGEVDLGSYAYGIWKTATDAQPGLARTIAELPNVVYATRAHAATPAAPRGVLLYLRTADDNDALAWVDEAGRAVTQSQLTILQAAACAPTTAALPRDERHHALVAAGVAQALADESGVGGGLGRPSGARFRAYERLKGHAEALRGTLLASPPLLKAIDEIYRYPLTQSATDTLNRQLKSGIADQALADLVVALRDDGRLGRVDDDAADHEPHIICSLGLFAAQGDA